MQKSVFLLAALLAGPAAAQDVQSVYTKIDFDKTCVWTANGGDEDVATGGWAKCEGLPGYPVYLAESDLRQFVSFGPVADPEAFSDGFGEFNHINHVVEWRLKDGKPYATILRWFVDTYDEAQDKEVEGQVLVISTVAQPDAPEAGRISCHVGYVDALANKNANALAREVADTMAEGFVCGDQRPEYFGKQGPAAGFPANFLL